MAENLATAAAPRRRLLSRLSLIPGSARQSPVSYNRSLVVYVAALGAVATGLAVVTVRVPSDWALLAAGAVVAGLLAGYSVRRLIGVESILSAAVFVHLGLSVILGPAGALAVSLADATGTTLRYRSGWFRFAFNVADFFLADTAAYATFHSLSGPRASGGGLIVAVIAATAVQFTVNHLLLAGVLRLATGTPVPTFMRRSLPLVPYSLGYGWATFGTVSLYRSDGLVGFSAILAPVLLLQAFVVFLAIRMEAYEKERAAHQLEREALLQRALAASESERQRIAAELHDGVVQDLLGLQLTFHGLAATADVTTPAAREMAAALSEGATTVRQAQKDLRTLMAELAPPTLRDEGLEPALQELLGKVERHGATPHLEVAPNLGLNEDHSRLIYRVTQEAVRNIIKHAGCESVWVSVTSDNNDVLVSVRDDGRGFDDAERARRQTEGHVGLGLLRQTAADGGGELAVTSIPGQGTQLLMRIPNALQPEALQSPPP